MSSVKQGLLVVISSPSGGGKDAVIRQLIKIIPRSARLVTTTTRAPRPKDQGGVDYHFTTKEKFEEKIKNGEMLEYAEYAGHYYGPEKKYFEDSLNNYDVVFTNVDIRGRQTLLKLNIPHLSIFIVPDNLENLRKRIEKRGGVAPQEMAERMDRAKKEISEAEKYDYKVINAEGKIDETVDNVAKIIQERLKKA